MILVPSSYFKFSLPASCSYRQASSPVIKPFNVVAAKQSGTASETKAEGNNGDPSLAASYCSRFCSCGRRHFIGGAAAAAAGFLPIRPSNASTDLQSDYMATLNKVHPTRSDWYEELYAYVLDSMEPYEAEVAAYKSQLFTNLKGKARKVLELGVGTGPNLRYYAGDTDVKVFGVDPNRKVERYAKEAAVAAGLSLENFKFIQAVGEAIPLSDASVDAVVGTLVLCSVNDVDQTLQEDSSSGFSEVKRVLKPGGTYLFVEHVAAKDGTPLRFLQSLLDPLQQFVADGCHLTRETGKNIFDAGFSSVDLSMASLSGALFLNPHVYGIARK